MDSLHRVGELHILNPSELTKRTSAIQLRGTLHQLPLASQARAVGAAYPPTPLCPTAWSPVDVVANQSTALVCQ